MKQLLESNSRVRDLLESISSSGKHWAIVGGAPRQWALGLSGPPDDLDIVVGLRRPSLKDLLQVWHNESCEHVAIRSTALGGYRLNFSDCTVDIWGVEETIGVAKGWVHDSKSFRAVSRSAALSLDSILVTCRGTVYERGFFKTLDTGVLTMNHCFIERPRKIAEKALRLCKQFGLVPDLSVQAHIAQFLGNSAVQELADSPQSAKG